MFERNTKQLTVILLVLGLTLACQGQQYITWGGGQADANGLGYWDEPGNWDTSMVPTVDYWVQIPGPNTTVVVDDYFPDPKVAQDITMAGGQDNVLLLITTSEGGTGEGNSLTCSRFFLAGDSGKNALVQLDAGVLNIGELNVCHQASDIPDGTVVINGGVANLGSLKLTGNSSECLATLIMNGGELNISNVLEVYGQPPAAARIELNDGIANVNKFLPSAAMTIDVNDGVLVLDGDQTILINGLVTTGQLTVAGQSPIRGGLSLIYDEEGDTTTVSADLDILSDLNKAWNPTPTPSAVDLPVDTAKLSWSAGDGTVATGGHDVYLGTDQDAVKNDTIDNGLGTYQGRIDDSELQIPGGVILGQTYYWRVDQITTDGTVYKGNLWSFSIIDSLMVDDFEIYDNNEPNEIWATWIDGVDVAENGMLVGNWNIPYAEQTIVKQGLQSMPLFYDNIDGVVNSEAKRSFEEAWNWKQNGIKSLSLKFRGESDNTFDTVYVKINETKVPYPLAVQHLKFAQWQTWIIDLNDVATDLTNVTSLAIGIDGTGSGILYIDDVRVYAKESELLSAGIEPDTTKLLAHYPLDGDAQDISGNGRHGTVVGTPNWVAGALDQALDMTGTRGFDGGDYDPTDGTGTFTLTTWCYWNGTDGVQHLMTMQNGWGTNTMMFQIEIKGYVGWVSDAALDRLHIAYANAPQARFFKVPRNEWSHIGLAFDGTHATAYLNGVDLNGPQPTGIGNYVQTPVMFGAENAGSRLLQGTLDDIRLYSYPLTQEEVQGTLDLELGYKPF